MMVSHWFEGGFGQFLAPDKNYKPDPDTMDTRSIIFQTLAPDPRFSADDNDGEKRAPAAAPPPAAAFNRHHPATVECVHCHLQTPVVSLSGATNTGGSSSNNNNAFKTPLSQRPVGPTQASGLTTARRTAGRGQIGSPKNALEVGMLNAIRDTREMADRNEQYQKNTRTFFQMANRPTSSLKVKDLTKIDRWLEEDQRRPTSEPSLLDARSWQAGSFSCPDGYTLLHAAASSNNTGVAQKLLDFLADDQERKLAILRATTIYGETAFHLAAREGHTDMVVFLTNHDPDGAAVLNVEGHTALAALMTSPKPKAQKNKDDLKDVLSNPNDPSLIGELAPAEERTFSILTDVVGSNDVDAAVCCGYSHLVGQRYYTEDAIGLLPLEVNGESFGYFAVCDGHGDKGSVAKFVAGEALPTALRQGIVDKSLPSSAPPAEYWTELFQSACLTVDEKVKETKLNGGSTAVFCLVTATQIIVGSVGDSGSILVECSPPAKPEETPTAPPRSAEQLAEDLEKLAVSEAEDKSEPVATPDLTMEDTKSAATVKALSVDHKPDLPDERARVEHAGFSVLEETYKDEFGREQSTSKIVLGDVNSTKLSMSRSFGDFEFKKNAELSAAEQAVVPVPDVCVLDRRTLAPESYLVLACDGVWDVKSNDEVATFLMNQVDGSKTAGQHSTPLLSSIGDDLLRSCLHSDDNLSVLVLALGQAARRFSSSAAGSPPALASARRLF